VHWQVVVDMMRMMRGHPRDRLPVARVAHVELADASTNHKELISDLTFADDIVVWQIDAHDQMQHNLHHKLAAAILPQGRLRHEIHVLAESDFELQLMRAAIGEAHNLSIQ
jgi:hypothetical protein